MAGAVKEGGESFLAAWRRRGVKREGGEERVPLRCMYVMIHELKRGK